MQNLALISGLIGALISAGLSYWVRATLDRRNIREAERKLAYVYFVRISEFVAAEIVVTSFIKNLVKVVGPQTQEFLRSKDGSFEQSHKLSVLFATEIKKLTPEKLKETPGLSIVPILLQSQLEAMSDSKLSAEQLSKLPKESVLSYSLFLNYLSHLRGVLLLWIAFFEQQQTSWVTPEAIHDQWLAVARLFEHARKLRSALLDAGAASPSEATELLQRQVRTYNENLLAKFQHQPKLQAAIVEAETSADASKV
jgi:hypothetical protein